jgi:acetolactate synthase-1/2/3 large subunit
MNLSDALVSTLRDWDLGYVFGVGGANIEHLFDSVHRLGRGQFQAVCAKSEIGAAFMADCRARTHRTLGVCCATSGGGMMNLAVGVAESFAESVPVLAIIGQPPTRLHGRGAFQDSSGIGRSVNAYRLWSAFTKYRTTINQPEDFWTSLAAAVRAALTGRRGPSALVIPRDLFDCDVGPRPAWLPDLVLNFAPPSEPPAEAINALLGAICVARSPVLLLGSGVDRCSNPVAVRDCARRVAVRVATTLASKNSFPNDDLLNLGMAGVAGEPSVHRYLKDEADLIVAVGTDLNVMTTQPIQAALQPDRVAIVNTDVAEALRVVNAKLFVEADEGAAFSMLNRLCEAAPIGRRRPTSIPIHRYTPQVAPDLPPPDFESPGAGSRGGLLQSEALETLQHFLPKQGHLLFDAGNCAAAALHYLRVPSSVSTTIALGMGGMGYAIAGAMGAQLGSARSARTMVFCGDGAFLMLGADVNTAVQYRLPILFVVFNNNMHGMCVTRQQLYFGGRIEGSRYPTVSIADLAHGLGSSERLWVASAGTTEELSLSLCEYFSRADGPGVLELRIRAEQIPPFTPFLASDAPTYVVSTPSGSLLPTTTAYSVGQAYA